MIVFRNVNNLAMGFFGPLFYVIPIAIYAILKFKAKRSPLPAGFASFERRAIAFLIDFALIDGLDFGLNILLSGMNDPPILLGKLIVLVFAIFNLIVLPSKTGWSLGKRILSIKIVKKVDQKPGIYDLLYREIIKSWFSLSVFFIGCFWMLIGKKHLTWHDAVADTNVFEMDWIGADNLAEEHNATMIKD